MDQVPVNPEDVDRIGRFAVNEENRKRPNQLTFVHVVYAFKGSAGEDKIYPLIIKIRDVNDKPFKHKALVLEKTDGSLNLKGYWE